MARVAWTDEASEQLDLIVSYIELFDVAAADRMGRRLLDLAASLRDFPNRGRPVKDGTREMVTVPPYILRYDVVGEDVLILGVRHGARRPD
ncbi:hypothetical protein ASG29_08760 [Sphingomonas sp. Leaf412]|uniref:type II toxin-antitoxin system RelE/ParE family toxin n=1 Tax=Sphingomonas sp. Leaf412 TaxID=1736370 RepID=UPI0006F471E5|nr:type II toxin-antitoxin system RelE/ParE family toxin [Sphingomonas sp. Leaf412]KQT31949.1 hypothetical protein ASG29_08760 [Sphingomonas sp. Leaf412]